jgi:spore maturation protein CgeB
VWDKSKSIAISEEQRSYWQGGNKNEFVVCLGYDRAKDSVTWCNAFSWCDDPKLEVATKRYFLDNPRIDLYHYAIWLENNIDLWHRKEFKDFDYLSVPLTSGQQTALLIITLLFNVLVAVVLVGNEHRNTNIYKTSVDMKRFGDYILSKEPMLRRIEKTYRDIKL